MSQNLQNFVKFQKFQLENLLDFEKCCKTHIFLQKSEPIQPKASNILPKFCQPTRRWRRIPRHHLLVGLLRVRHEVVLLRLDLHTERFRSCFGNVAIVCEVGVKAVELVSLFRIDFDEIVWEFHEKSMSFKRSCCICPIVFKF